MMVSKDAYTYIYIYIYTHPDPDPDPDPDQNRYADPVSNAYLDFYITPPDPDPDPYQWKFIYVFFSFHRWRGEKGWYGWNIWYWGARYLRKSGKQRG